jgi:prepilin-type N-terminal cleavage/methylation domain-containing protein
MSSIRNKLGHQQSHGFTLVELLVVISIIGVMSGMFILAYRGASQESMTQKTRSTIQKISEVLNARMDEYENFPLTLRDNFTGNAISSNVVPFGTETATTLRERARLMALRDIIRMEMPDHPDDLKFTTYWRATLSPPGNFIDYLGTVLPRSINTGMVDPSYGTSVFIQNQLTARSRSLMTKLSNSAGLPINEWDKTNANAELLYLIVEDSELYGSSAIELFGKTEIADTDGDQLYEFVDSFGQPIQWIRWPAGVKGASRTNPDMLNPALVDSLNGRLAVNSETLDRSSSDPGWGTAFSPGQGLAPLVVSAGIDKSFGIRFRTINRYGGVAPSNFVGTFLGQTSYSVGDATWALPLYGATVMFTDPWYPRNNPVDQMGAPAIVSDPPEENGNSSNSVWANDNISNFDGTAVSL